MAKPRAAISWSGGKDSCAALARARSSFDDRRDGDDVRRGGGAQPIARPASRSARGAGRSPRPASGHRSLHVADLRRAVLAGARQRLAAEGITHVVFGDILFDEHRQWAERMCAPHGLDRRRTALRLLDDSALFESGSHLGREASIVTARCEFLDETWLGRPLRSRTACRIRTAWRRSVRRTRRISHGGDRLARSFASPIRLSSHGHVQRSGCWALDVTVERCSRRVTSRSRTDVDAARRITC